MVLIVSIHIRKYKIHTSTIIEPFFTEFRRHQARFYLFILIISEYLDRKFKAIEVVKTYTKCVVCWN